MKGFIFLFALVSTAFSADKIQVKVTDKIIGETDERYLSFAIDMANLVGGKWWDGSDGTSGGRGEVKTEPLDLSQPELLKYSKMLYPAYVRVGGSEADSVYYDLSDNPAELPPEKFHTVLTKQQMLGLGDYVKETGLDLFWTLSTGPSVMQRKRWQPEMAAKLIKFNQDHNIPVAVYEFGNEPNAFWLNYGLHNQMTMGRYTKNFRKAQDLLRDMGDKVPLIGPSVAFWPIIGEPLKIFGGTSKTFLRKLKRKLPVYTWHYYPVQSDRCFGIKKSKPGKMLDPKHLDTIIREAKKVRKWRDRYRPEAALWLGETGGAQCGGQKGVSDAYEDLFWWLDQLALMAQHDTKVMVRQALIGGDYGLLDHETLTPRPSFWASLLWKRVMGTKVLKAHKNKLEKKLRVYSHCLRPDHELYQPGAIAVLALNLDKFASKRLDFPYGKGFEYNLSAPMLSSGTLLINDHYVVNDDKDLKGRSFVDSSELDAKEISFYIFPDANLESCQ